MITLRSTFHRGHLAIEAHLPPTARVSNDARLRSGPRHALSAAWRTDAINQSRGNVYRLIVYACSDIVEAAPLMEIPHDKQL